MDWIHVNDKLPTNKEGEFYLIYGEDEDGDREVYKAYLGSDNYWYWRDIEFSNVTHWMPLPAPPNH
jgi:hypothetical protein